MWTSYFNINLIIIKILLLMVKKIIKSVVKNHILSTPRTGDKPSVTASDSRHLPITSSVTAFRRSIKLNRDTTYVRLRKSTNSVPASTSYRNCRLGWNSAKPHGSSHQHNAAPAAPRPCQPMLCSLAYDSIGMNTSNTHAHAKRTNSRFLAGRQPETSARPMFQTRIGRVCPSRSQLSEKYSHHAHRNTALANAGAAGSSAGAPYLAAVTATPAGTAAAAVTEPAVRLS